MSASSRRSPAATDEAAAPAAPASLTAAALAADARLAEVSDELRFLFHVTPVNTEEARAAFQASGFRRAPELLYRPLPYDPELLARGVREAPVEDAAEPAVRELLGEKQGELLAKLEMLGHRGEPRFRELGMEVYGGVEEGLVETAKRLLYRLDAGARAEPVRGRLDAAAFAAMATAEIAAYRKVAPAFGARVEIRDDLPPSLMVTGDTLRIGAGIHVPRSRADALIHHEVGTHLVTRFNGGAQPLSLFACGFAGYDALQEGLAVLAEYLVGQLDRGRLRTLAGRVVAVASLVAGASFPETFDCLRGRFGFDPATAFTITLRVHRAGGLTKDAVYLRGLVALLAYLGEGGAYEPLLVGKIDLRHVPLVETLLARGLLVPPALIPRYFAHESCAERLARVYRGVDAIDLTEDAS